MVARASLCSVRWRDASLLAGSAYGRGPCAMLMLRVGITHDNFWLLSMTPAADLTRRPRVAIQQVVTPTISKATREELEIDVIDTTPFAMFGVFDGHGGAACAEVKAYQCPRDSMLPSQGRGG